MMRRMSSEPTKPRLERYKRDPKTGLDVFAWTSRWYDDRGKQRRKRFGLGHLVDDGEALRAYKNWKKREWDEKEQVRNPESDAATYTVQQLALDYSDHAAATYRKNGKPTSHVADIGCAMQAIIDAWGLRPVISIESHELAKLRDGMIWVTGVGGERLKPRSLKTVNGRLSIIKDAFRWAATEKGRVPEAKAVAMRLVKPLAKGRSAAKDPKKIKSVSDDWVEQTKRNLPSALKTMVDVQRLAGMRPGEVCVMRPCDIETYSDDVWLYRPHTYKMEHKDAVRIVALGPKCIELLRPFLKRQHDTQAYLFSPAEAHAERLAAKRAGREVKMWPSHKRRLSENPVEGIGGVYSEQTYRKAIHHACKLTWPFPDHKTDKELAKLAAADPAALAAHRVARKAWQDQHRWNPNQIRHSAATIITRQFGIAVARDVLGHADIATTQLYLDPDLQSAIEAARKVG